jgi:hypothetical protein
LATDLAALEQVIEETAALLVIIDPLSAYFGTRLDSYRDSDVRSVLEPVVRLAERRGVAVLGIMHVGKASDRQARHRALGSVAFVNAARLVVGPDPNDANRRLLVPVKANLCREAPALAFRLEDADGVARVAWETAPDPSVSADVVLSGKPLADDDERVDAESLLRQLLDTEAWPMRATDVEAAGRAHGIHVRSLQRAARRLGFRIEKMGMRDGWRWCAPAEDDTAAACRPPSVTACVSSSALDQSKTPANSEDDTKTTDQDFCRLQFSYSKTTLPPKIDQVSSSENIDVLSKTTHVVFEDDTQTHPPRAREAADEGLPAWVTDITVEDDGSGME